MGGAIATHVVFRGKISNIIGLVVLDLVEGSALESIPHIEKIVNNRPTSFHTIVDAIQYRFNNI